MSLSFIDSVSSSGICYRARAKETALIPWSEVESVGALKRSDGRQEFACVWVRTRKEEFPLEFDAHDPKWNQFVAALATELVGSKSFEKWFPEPLHPAFEINVQNVYEKGA